MIKNKFLNFRLTIAKKLISGLLFLTMIGALLGGTGILFITNIDKTLNNITDVTAPTVETADDLRANIWQSTKVAEEIIADEELADIKVLIEEFRVLAAEYDVSYKELDILVDDEDLLDEITKAKSSHEDFIRNSEAMFAAHTEELNEEITADNHLDAFDVIGGQLIVMLDEFAIENEEEMQKLEDQGDVLVASGKASAAQLNDLLGTLFEEDYPVVEAALKLQRLVMEMQDTAGEYMAVEDPTELPAISDEFLRLSGLAQPYFDVLHNLAETQEDKDDAVELEKTFDEWVSQAKQEEQLFDTHRDMLRAEKMADELTEKLELDADQVAAVLDIVAEKADALSDSADEKAAKVVTTAKVTVGIGVLVAVIASALLILMIIQTVTSQITRMTAAMGMLADGNLNTDIPALGRQDEIGDMAQAVEVFKNNAIEVERLNQEQKEQEIIAKEKQRKMMLELADNFDSQLGGLITSLSTSSSQMKTTAGNMKSVANEMTESSSNVATASGESSVNASTVASAMEEMVATIKEIASQMNLARTKSDDARISAEAANDTVDNLNERVQNIGEVVVAIQDIAEQTNLLALNATIEAARAGDAGKGFAVVADEVKKLASETALKTNEINEKIMEVQGATTETVTAMTKIISNISEINESVTVVSAAIEEQNSTSQEINRSISEAAHGAQQVSSVITNVKQQAEDTGQSAETVLNAASDMSDLSTTIKDSVDSFLSSIRTDNNETVEQNVANKPNSARAA